MTLDIQIEALEARVLGVLIEKELTTPEQYPLTLNSVTLGSNQKNNRDPVLDVMEGDVAVALQKLARRGLVGVVHPVGSRVEKYRHNAGAVLKLESAQFAVLSELLMRGPQAPGELRTRVTRMVPCETQERLMEILRPMLESGMVVRLDPIPGTRAERYAQKLAPDAHPLGGGVSASPAASAYPAGSVAAVATPRASSSYSAPATAAPMRDARVGPLETRVDEQDKRIVELENGVARLRRQLDQLAWQLGKKLEG